MFTREEKLLWGDGPWVDEPDYLNFKYRDINCFIERKYHGALCGYILLQKSNKYTKKNNWKELNVHGTITYAESVLISKNFPDETIQRKRMFAIGFDCVHPPDYPPQLIYIDKTLSSIVALKDIKDRYRVILNKLDYYNSNNYRDMKFVKKELQKLVDQVLDT